MSEVDKLLKRVDFYEKVASEKEKTQKFSYLLDKVSVFEKLALYPDVKSFLVALAQQPQNTITNESYIKNTILELSNAIQGWISSNAEKQPDLPSGAIRGLPIGMRMASNVIMQAAKSDTYDSNALSAIDKATKDIANLSNLGNIGTDARNAWMQNVFPHASRLVELVNKQIENLQDWNTKYSPSEAGNGVIELNNTTISAKPYDGWTGPRINPVFQTMLQMNPDGKLGDKTKGALNTYKKSRGNPNMTDQEAFELLKKEPEFKSKSPMNYDDNSDTYVKSPDIVRENPF